MTAAAKRMRQLRHAGAPFPTEDAAHEAAAAVMRRLCKREGGSPIGWAVEPQPNGEGFYVRVAYSVTIPATSVLRRKRRESRAAEVGLIRCDALTAARVALVRGLHAQSRGGVVERGEDDPGVADVKGLTEIDLEQLATAVVRAIRKGTGE